jgi:hypothetical protein
MCFASDSEVPAGIITLKMVMGDSFHTVSELTARKEP